MRMKLSDKFKTDSVSTEEDEKVQLLIGTDIVESVLYIVDNNKRIMNYIDGIRDYIYGKISDEEIKKITNNVSDSVTNKPYDSLTSFHYIETATYYIKYDMYATSWHVIQAVCMSTDMKYRSYMAYIQKSINRSIVERYL